MKQKNEESTIQTDIVEYLRLRRIFVFSVPNEAAGKIHSRAGLSKVRKLKAMGLTSGVSDLIAWVGARTLYLEVKTPTGKASPNQKTFRAECEAQGREYYLVRSVKDVEKILEELS